MHILQGRGGREEEKKLGGDEGQENATLKKERGVCEWINQGGSLCQ